MAIPPTKRRGATFSLSPVFLAGMVAVIAAGAVMTTHYHAATTAVPLAQEPPSQTGATPDVSPSNQPTTTPTDLGPKTLSVLGDLGLYTTAPGDASITYYSAGSISSGPYAGYTRIISVYRGNGPFIPVSDTFATKDNATYVINGRPGLAVSAQGASGNFSLNLAKVSSAADLNDDLPANIPLDNTYILHKDVPALGDNDSDSTLQTNFSGYSPLSSINGLKLYVPKMD